MLDFSNQFTKPHQNADLFKAVLDRLRSRKLPLTNSMTGLICSCVKVEQDFREGETGKFLSPTGENECC